MAAVAAHVIQSFPWIIESISRQLAQNDFSPFSLTAASSGFASSVLERRRRHL